MSSKTIKQYTSVSRPNFQYNSKTEPTDQNHYHKKYSRLIIYCTPLPLPFLRTIRIGWSSILSFFLAAICTNPWYVQYSTEMQNSQFHKKVGDPHPSINFPFLSFQKNRIYAHRPSFHILTLLTFRLAWLPSPQVGSHLSWAFQKSSAALLPVSTHGF